MLPANEVQSTRGCCIRATAASKLVVLVSVKQTAVKHILQVTSNRTWLLRMLSSSHCFWPCR
jgi:hypothetical protein